MRKLLTLLLCVPLIGLTQQTYVPDDDFETYLENNGIGNGIVNDDYVLTSAIDTVSELHLGFFISNISDLTGIEDFIMLEELFCDNNQLTMLDLSNNSHLVEVVCANNNLVQMDVRNGNNQNLFYFMSMFNPSLNCIDVDDVAYCEYTWAVDTWTSFSNNCFPTHVNGVTNNKKLIRVIDIHGRIISPKPNIPLIYIYSDGSREKKIFIQ